MKLSVIAAVVLITGGPAAALAAPPKPNSVLIFADDKLAGEAEERGRWHRKRGPFTRRR